MEPSPPTSADLIWMVYCYGYTIFSILVYFHIKLYQCFWLFDAYKNMCKICNVDRLIKFADEFSVVFSCLTGRKYMTPVCLFKKFYHNHGPVVWPIFRSSLFFDAFGQIKYVLSFMYFNVLTTDFQIIKSPCALLDHIFCGMQNFKLIVKFPRVTKIVVVHSLPQNLIFY